MCPLHQIGTLLWDYFLTLVTYSCGSSPKQIRKVEDSIKLSLRFGVPRSSIQLFNEEANAALFNKLILIVIILHEDVAHDDRYFVTCFRNWRILVFHQCANCSGRPSSFGVFCTISRELCQGHNSVLLAVFLLGFQ